MDTKERETCSERLIGVTLTVAFNVNGSRFGHFYHLLEPEKAYKHKGRKDRWQSHAHFLKEFGHNDTRDDWRG